MWEATHPALRFLKISEIFPSRVDKHNSESLCVWNVCIDDKLPNAGGRSVMVSLLPTKTLTIDGDTRFGQSGVPALLWSPVAQGLIPMYFILQSLLVNGIRLRPEPVNRLFFSRTYTFAAIWNLGGLFTPLFGSIHAHLSPTFSYGANIGNFR